MRGLSAALAAAALAVAAFAAPAAAADDRPPRLLGRAILPSDAYQPGPPSGAFITGDNGVTPPFPGQPIPGFSAVLDAGHGQFWAMPDNGYGAKANSGDFLLRLYRIRPEFKTAAGGTGTVAVLGFLQLRDPDQKVPFPLFRSDRLLTGADFDLESVRQAKDGSFWFGEEFGPFLVHTDATGKVLEAPVPLPGVQSPQNPFLPDPDAWTLGMGSSGRCPTTATGPRTTPVTSCCACTGSGPTSRPPAAAAGRWRCSASCSYATPTGRSRSRCFGRIGC